MLPAFSIQNIYLPHPANLPMLYTTAVPQHLNHNSPRPAHSTHQAHTLTRLTALSLSHQ